MQQYIDNKYFEVIERVIVTRNGNPRITLTTKITGKGQVALTKKIRESN
jgi:phage antirepressor YoqD-like protein